ncbi:hypothetical protein DFJ73DRAFT_148314, partial [Zopfochytrium polystomum]
SLVRFQRPVSPPFISRPGCHTPEQLVHRTVQLLVRQHPAQPLSHRSLAPVHRRAQLRLLDQDPHRFIGPLRSRSLHHRRRLYPHHPILPLRVPHHRPLLPSPHHLRPRVLLHVPPRPRNPLPKLPDPVPRTAQYPEHRRRRRRYGLRRARHRLRQQLRRARHRLVQRSRRRGRRSPHEAAPPRSLLDLSSPLLEGGGPAVTAGTAAGPATAGAVVDAGGVCPRRPPPPPPPRP